MDGDKRIRVYSGLPHRELVAHMQNAHAFVAPTHADPFNNTILEAMACGAPVITSNIRSIPEFVYDKENGYLIDFSDYKYDKTVSELKQHILELYSDTRLRKQFAEKSLDICKTKFDIRVRNAKLKEIYDDAMKG